MDTCTLILPTFCPVSVSVESTLIALTDSSVIRLGIECVKSVHWSGRMAVPFWNNPCAVFLATKRNSGV